MLSSRKCEAGEYSTHSDRQNVFKVVKHMILAMDPNDAPPRRVAAETLHAGVGLGSFQSTTVISFWLNEPSTMPKIGL